MPLSLAAQNGHEAVVKLLLMTGKADINSKDYFSWTLLFCAAWNRHEAVVKLLLIVTGSPPQDFVVAWSRPYPQVLPRRLAYICWLIGRERSHDEAFSSCLYIEPG